MMMQQIKHKQTQILGQILAEQKSLREKSTVLINKYLNEQNHKRALKFLREINVVEDMLRRLEDAKEEAVKTIFKQLVDIHPAFEDANVDAFHGGVMTPCGLIQGHVLVIRVEKFHVDENEFKRIISALREIGRKQEVDVILAVDWWENRMPPAPKPVCDYFYYVYHIRR